MRFLTFLIVFIVLSLGLGGQSFAANEARRYQKLMVFLAQYPVLRVAISDSPGNGHQSAGATVVQRLREMGYEGEIEVVYDCDATAEKLEFLLPPFKGSSYGSVQIYKNEKLKFIAAGADFGGTKTLAKVPLAIMGADDRNITTKQLNAESLLKLQPYHWNSSPSLTLRVANTKRFYELYGLKEYGYFFRPPVPSDVGAFLKSNLASSKFRQKLPFFEALFLNNHGWEILPVYGHGIRNNDNQLKLLLRGLLHGGHDNKSVFVNGIVIPVLNELPPDEIEKLRRNLESLQNPADFSFAFFDVDSPELLAALQRPKDRRIIVVNVGSIPKPVFEYLYYRETLPGVVEGKNSINLMAILGKPYLPSSWQEGFPFFEDEEVEKIRFTFELPEIDKLIGKAWWELSNSGRDGSTIHLTQFYLLANQKPSRIANYFKDHSMMSQGSFEVDQLLLGLEFYRKKLQDQLKQIKKVQIQAKTKGSVSVGNLCRHSLKKILGPFGASIDPYR